MAGKDTTRSTKPVRNLGAEALEFHMQGRPGKLEISPTKPLTTQRDLSLAYSPGVAEPCLKIAEDPAKAYDYTAKGNLVAVISNGTAVLGLGNLGAVASKPVMEGKAVLFKRFADVDGIDLEVSTEDVDEFVNCVRYLGASFGGINLEDIKGPECFIIEDRLKELMDIPVFHDDQHGTAIIAAAGMINALHLTGRDLADTTMVINGAGAAGIACAELVKAMGFKPQNVIMCDTRGVIYQGRKDGMNQWKSAHAVKTKKRTLEEALDGADIFFGVSAKGAVTPEMAASMAPKPIIFAMANPDPEITPEEVAEIRDDAIIATGRSDYPNQVNNVLGFPYIFRGALDVQATTINMEMKIAAVHALANLAREDVPDEVDRAYSGKRLRYGSDYIIPAPFDPRLIVEVPMAVAKAAMDSGVAQRPIEDLAEYEKKLSARLDPTVSSLQNIITKVREHDTRMIFAEGEEEKVIRAAHAFASSGLGQPILVGREDQIRQTCSHLGLPDDFAKVVNAGIGNYRERYTEFLYNRLKRKGYLYRDCVRSVNQNRNVFAGCMLACGEADALVTGLTRNFNVAYDDLRRCLDPKPDNQVFALNLMIHRGQSIFIADTQINELPSAEQLADMAEQCAKQARAMGHEPRVALLSFSSFGNPPREKAMRVREAIEVLDSRRVDFEYDGEMQASVALNYELMSEIYPFCRLSGPANILIMPALHSANICVDLLKKMSTGTMIGPLLIGLEQSAQILPIAATVSDIVNTAALAAHGAINERLL
ncbi:NADP-dependent malic enzyme [Rhodovibrionaceae bacterium A322]